MAMRKLADQSTTEHNLAFIKYRRLTGGQVALRSLEVNLRPVPIQRSDQCPGFPGSITGLNLQAQRSGRGCAGNPVNFRYGLLIRT